MDRGADKFTRAYHSGFRLEVPEFWPEQIMPPAKWIPANPYNDPKGTTPKRSGKLGANSALEAIFAVSSRETKKSVFQMFARFLVAFGVVPLEKQAGSNARCPQRMWHLGHIEAFCAIYAASEAASTTVLQYASIIYATLEAQSAMFSEGYHRTLSFFRNVRSIAGQSLPTRAKILTFNAFAACPFDVRRLLLFWILSGLRRVSLVALGKGDVSLTNDGIVIQVGSSKVGNVRRSVKITCNCTNDQRGATACPFHGLPGLAPVPDIPISPRWLDAVMTRLGIAFHSPRRTLIVSIFDELEGMLTASAVQAVNRHMLWTANSSMAFQYGFDFNDFRSVWLLPAKSVIAQFQHLHEEGKGTPPTKVGKEQKIKALTDILTLLDQVTEEDDEEQRDIRRRIEELRVMDARIEGPQPTPSVPYMEGPLLPARPHRVAVGQPRAEPSLRRALQYHSGSTRGPTPAGPPAGALPRKRGRPRKFK